METLDLIWLGIAILSLVGTLYMDEELAVLRLVFLTFGLLSLMVILMETVDNNTKAADRRSKQIENLELRQTMEQTDDFHRMQRQDLAAKAAKFIGLPPGRTMNEEERYYNPRVKEYDAYIAGHNAGIQAARNQQN